MSSFKTLDDLPADLTGQVALVRVDLNLPMKDGAATDVTRVEAAKPTILELTEKGAKVLLLAHFELGRHNMSVHPLSESLPYLEDSMRYDLPCLQKHPQEYERTR